LAPSCRRAWTHGPDISTILNLGTPPLGSGLFVLGSGCTSWGWAPPLGQAAPLLGGRLLPASALQAAGEREVGSSLPVLLLSGCCGHGWPQAVQRQLCPGADAADAPLTRVPVRAGQASSIHGGRDCLLGNSSSKMVLARQPGGRGGAFWKRQTEKMTSTATGSVRCPWKPPLCSISSLVPASLLAVWPWQTP
jgi:hypothetical protein